MSCSTLDPLSGAVHFLLGPVCKPPIGPQQRLSIRARCRLTFCCRNAYTTWGHFTSAIRRKNPDCFSAADCVRIVQRVTSFSRLTGMVLFSLTDQKRGEKISRRHEKQKGLAVGKSALCLVQFKSKDNQECLFDNSIYNALF